MKKFLLLAVVAIATLTACSGDDDSGSSSGTMLPRKITSDGLSGTVTYDGTKIKSINYPDGGKEFFTYDGDRIVKIENKYGNVVDERTVYTYHADGKLASATNWYTFEEDLEFAHYLVFTHNDNGTVSVSSYTNPQGTGEPQTGTIQMQNGNITGYSMWGETGTFTFDDKNSPWKNVMLPPL